MLCFSVQAHGAVGIGNAALKGQVKDKWWKIGTYLSDIK